MATQASQEGMKAKPGGLEAPMWPYDQTTKTEIHKNEMTEAPNFRDAGFIILIIKRYIYIDRGMYNGRSRWLKRSTK